MAIKINGEVIKPVPTNFSALINGKVKESLAHYLLDTFIDEDGNPYTELDLIIRNALIRMEKTATMKDLLSICQIVGDNISMSANNKVAEIEEEKDELPYDDGLKEIALKKGKEEDEAKE